MHVTDAHAMFNAIAMMAATYIQSKTDIPVNDPPPKLRELVKRPVVSPKEWLYAMCSQQADRHAQTDDVFVPTVEQLRNIPRVFDTVSLLASQLAIIASLVHAPTRVSSIRGDGVVARAACSVPVGVRPVVRLNFSPAGTGKTLMSLVAAVAFIKEHFATYSLADLWRADLFGCIANTKPIAPLVFCVVSNTVHSQWKETAHACARAFAADGYAVSAFPKPGASTVNSATVIDAVNAIGLAGGGAVIYVVSSAYAHRAMEALPFLPASFVMDEISHDACRVKYVPLPLTLLITASPKSITHSLVDKPRGTILRTIFDDESALTPARIAACNTAEPYYMALATEAAALMPPTINFCALEVKFDRRSNLTIGPTMDPCQFITRDELCRLMDIDPLNKTTLRHPVRTRARPEEPHGHLQHAALQAALHGERAERVHLLPARGPPRPRRWRGGGGRRRQRRGRLCASGGQRGRHAVLLDDGVRVVHEAPTDAAEVPAVLEAPRPDGPAPHLLRVGRAARCRLAAAPSRRWTSQRGRVARARRAAARPGSPVRAGHRRRARLRGQRGHQAHVCVVELDRPDGRTGARAPVARGVHAARAARGGAAAQTAQGQRPVDRALQAGASVRRRDDDDAHRQLD